MLLRAIVVSCKRGVYHFKRVLIFRHCPRNKGFPIYLILKTVLPDFVKDIVLFANNMPAPAIATVNLQEKSVQVVILVAPFTK